MRKHFARRTRYRTASLLGAAVVLAVPALGAAEPVQSTDHDPTDIVPDDAELEQVFDGGCLLTSGPAAAPDGAIYFTDITLSASCQDDQGNPQAGIIWRYDPATGETNVFRSPSGKANGMQFDASGDLVVTEGADFGGRRVTRTDMDTGKAWILAASYDGDRLNSPNGISIDEQGRIYFTDPRYNGPEPVDQPVEGIYRIDPDGTLERVIVNATKPNGVLVSPDQQTLWVSDFNIGVLDTQRLTEEELASVPPVQMALYAYDLNEDGSVGHRRKVVDYLPDLGPDGITADVHGNIYVAVRDTSDPGITVYSPEGFRLAHIATGDVLPTAGVFGRSDESNVLYITAGASLWRIPLNTEGYHLPPAGN